MITIPISVFLIIYLVILVLLGIFFAVNFFHIILTGTTTFSSFLATLFVFVSITLVLLGTWHLLQGIDWSQTITIWDNSWFNQSINTI